MLESNNSKRLLLAASREFKSYADGRARLYWRLHRYQHELAAQLPSFAAKRLFALKKGWKVLDFNDRDWPIISSLRESSPEISLNYHSFLIEYILYNADRVRNLQSVHDGCTEVLLGSNPDKIVGILDVLDAVDQQCAFVFKLNGYMKGGSDEKGIIDYLRDRSNSNWVRTRLLYPLTYHTINVPTDDYLDTFLSYMLPQDDSGGIERLVARHVLRDDITYDECSGFRGYIGLMSHPFDAMDSVANEIEIAFCKDTTLPDHLETALDRLADAFPASRISRIRSQIRNFQKIGSQEWPRWTEESPLPPELRPVLNAIVSLDGECPDLETLPTDEWRAVCRMRWSRYPEVADYEHVSRIVRALRFIEAGQVFSCLMTSMYMMMRQPELYERRQLMRLHRLVGATAPYLWAAPGGNWLMRSQTAGGGQWLGADLRAGVELDRQLASPNRVWFHAVHWRLGKAERAGKVREWLELVRTNFPVRPSYLTGIDWRWIDQILQVVRITPFRSSIGGPYALLLRDIETGTQDSTELRTAIEPLVEGAQCSTFIERLAADFGVASVAFVRFFLTPENIMLMGMAPNMTAALSERISALEQCATLYRFGELLSEDQLRHEQQALTSSLMLLNVNANQFDIPWGSFSRDAASRQRDNYDVFYAFSKSNQTLSIITKAPIIYGHQFKNGRQETYNLHSNNHTLAYVILGVIDTFLDHPSYGIEAILSTRFRHDTLRREFVVAFDEIEKSHIQGIVSHDQRKIVGELAYAALDELDFWLGENMQTVREGHPDAVFDFIPSEEQLFDMMGRASDDGGIESIIDVVIAWIRPRLEAQLAIARSRFLEGFVPLAQSAIAQRSSEIAPTILADPQVLFRLTTIASDTVLRRAEALLEWFRVPSAGAQPSLTFDQVAAAVVGRFESYVADARLSVTRSAAVAFSTELQPAKVRLFFDLASEIIHNALKYSGLKCTRVRILFFEQPGQWGAVFSSQATVGDRASKSIAGHPYESLSDALFREGNSGLMKIAALAASILGAECDIKAERRGRSFHIRVPLGCNIP